MSLIPTLKAFTEASVTAYAWVVLLCSILDASFPVPKPGSRWIALRRVISTVALSVGAATNRILPGSAEATVSNLDVLRRVALSHEEAQPQRTAIVEKLNALVPTVQEVPARLQDLTKRVDTLVAERPAS